jgi:hypothetical protein
MLGTAVSANAQMYPDAGLNRLEDSNYGLNRLDDPNYGWPKVIGGAGTTPTPEAVAE